MNRTSDFPRAHFRMSFFLYRSARGAGSDDPGRCEPTADAGAARVGGSDGAGAAPSGDAACMMNCCIVAAAKEITMDGNESDFSLLSLGVAKACKLQYCR